MKNLITGFAVVIIALCSCKTKNKTVRNSTYMPADSTQTTYIPPSDGIVRAYKAYNNTEQDTIRLSDGIKYILIASGTGPAITCGDKASIIYTGRLMNDTLFDATSLHGKNPYAFELCAHKVIAGWDSVILHLHGGDVAEMFLPARYAYGARQMGKIPANAPLKFLVEVANVTQKPKPWDATGKDTITTPSGLKMVMFESHQDAVKAQKGKTVTLDYSGFLLDGTMFDSSIPRGRAFSFILGQSPVIEGWNEGVGMLHVGEKAKFIIPSSLGYGDEGYAGLIPAKATLVFDVTLISVK